jgi:hypothetical protein
MIVVVYETMARARMQLAFAEEQDESFRPLLGRREFYLSLYNNEDYVAEDPRWESMALPVDEVCSQLQSREQRGFG